MKFEWNKKYNTIAIYSILVIIISISFFLGITKFAAIKSSVSQIIGVFKPFIIGFVIAYILNFNLSFFEDKILIKKLSRCSKKKRRAISMLITYVLFFTAFYLFFYFVIPQLTNSVGKLISDSPVYFENGTKTVEDFIVKLDLNKEISDMAMSKFLEIQKKALDFIANLVPYFANVVRGIAESVWNIVLGIIISIYLLMEKEKYFAMSKKITCGVFNKINADRLFDLVELTNDTFGKFIIGKIIDSMIIAVLTFVILSIFKIPYTILIAVIIGITNIIPFFGPFFGAIPSVILVAFVSPVKAVTLLIIILVIQQLDGNIIGPKILGDSIGISSFWILFSLLVAGKLMGIVGMIIGVPLFAVVYEIVSKYIDKRLKNKGLPTDIDKYC